MVQDKNGEQHWQGHGNRVLAKHGQARGTRIGYPFCLSRAIRSTLRGGLLPAKLADGELAETLVDLDADRCRTDARAGLEVVQEPPADVAGQ